MCIEFSISIHERHERFNKQKSIACIFIVILAAAAAVVFVVVVVATTSSCAIEPVIAFQNVKIEMFVYIIRIFGLRPLSLSFPRLRFSFFVFNRHIQKSVDIRAMCAGKCLVMLCVCECCFVGGRKRECGVMFNASFHATQKFMHCKLL